MKNNKLSLILIAVIAVIALIGRCYQLDRRPMHTDEAVHAIKFAGLLDSGTYRYDPHEYHGPTLYYFSLPVAWLRGQHSGTGLDETTLRLVSVFTSALFFIPLFFLGKYFKGYAPVVAAAVAGISPIMVYLSRYFIHEVFLVAFVFSFIVFAWRYLTDSKIGWAIAAGVSLGLAMATKETVALSIMALGLAGIVLLMSESVLRNEWGANWRQSINWKHLSIGLAAMIIVVVLFYSSFFSNMAGLTDYCKTYFYYLSRAGGQGHEKPWYYYLQLLGFFRNGPGFTGTEIYILLAATVAGVYSFLRPIKDRTSRLFVKFLFVYSIGLMVIYSCIPYKMPWLALNWMQPMTVLAGIGIVWLVSSVRNITAQVAVMACCLCAACHLAYQVKWENGRFQCDRRNPYVYSHTSTNFIHLPTMLKDVAALDPAKSEMPIQIMSDEYWPLPWYLRDMANVGYWHSVPEKELAPAIVTSLDLAKELAPQLNDEYISGMYTLRSGVILMAHVRKDLWKRYLDERSRIYAEH